MDLDSDTAKLLFSPLRHINQEEWEIAKKAGESIEAKNAITMTVAQSDGVRKPLVLEGKPLTETAFDAEEEVIEEPVKRVAKKADTPAPAGKSDLASVINAWSDA